MDVRFTPQMFVNNYVIRRGLTIEDIGVAPVVVISWSQSVIQSFAEATDAHPCPHWLWNENYLFYTGQVHGQRVSFGEVPVGAPATVATMEEMIACGARLFLGIGWTGSLNPSAPVGTFLIPTSCIREEGTSFHYVDDDAALVPNERLVELLNTAVQAELAQAALGPQWTTDALYRESCSKIAAYQQLGVLGVDMETSAMYALGHFRNVPVCNLMVVSDELWQDWRPAFGTPQLKVAMVRAQRIILRVLASDNLL